MYHLVGPDGKQYSSRKPGLFGGHRKLKIYGLLNCWSAKKAIERGGYVRHRVFFASEEDATSAGYRPCGKCLKLKYLEWVTRK